jgi:hypothetical protein
MAAAEIRPNSQKYGVGGRFYMKLPRSHAFFFTTMSGYVKRFQIDR